MIRSRGDDEAELTIRAGRETLLSGVERPIVIRVEIDDPPGESQFAGVLLRVGIGVFEDDAADQRGGRSAKGFSRHCLPGGNCHAVVAGSRIRPAPAGGRHGADAICASSQAAKGEHTAGACREGRLAGVEHAIEVFVDVQLLAGDDRFAVVAQAVGVGIVVDRAGDAGLRCGRCLKRGGVIGEPKRFLFRIVQRY